MNNSLLYSIHNLDSGLMYQWFYGDDNITIADIETKKTQNVQLHDNTFLGFAFAVWDHEGRPESDCLYTVTDLDSEIQYDWLESTDYLDIRKTNNPEDNQRIQFSGNSVAFEELVDSHRRSYWLGDDSRLLELITVSI